MSVKEEEKRGTTKDLLNQHIVGIGASAGGLEAILDLFDSMPHDLDCSYIIVQHLSPDYKSMMPELLEKHTKMKIFEAQDGMLVKPNAIYVIPHKKNMTFRSGKLQLTDKENNKAPNTAIDIFFKSLAEAKKERAIGIVLSGTGSDGTRGLETIKKAGGLTIAQEPLTAKFDGMPNSAINSGNADFVLAPEHIHEEILRYVSGSHSSPEPYPTHLESEEPIISEILNTIKSKLGYDFTSYKRPTIIRRINKRMTFLNISLIQDYKNLIQKDLEETKLLCKDFLIGVTKFFRDDKAFAYISNEVLPEIFKNKSSGQEIKFWVAGCSTGEEAYTSAILVHEYLEKQKKQFDIKIFATDIDKDAIDHAAKGIYSKNILKDVSEGRIKKHFEQVGDKFKILPHIRKMVVFAQHDLVRNAPYSKTDLISCRNVLIYLSPVLQKSILSKFHFSLNTNGYLFLGPSENIGGYENVFVEIEKKAKIFKNISTEKRLPLDGFSNQNQVTTSYVTEGKPIIKPERFNIAHNSSVLALSDILLKESDYSALYINDSFELIQASGNYSQYVHLPKQNFDLNVLKMVPNEVSIALGTALRKASKTGERVFVSGVKVEKKQVSRTIEVVVIPVEDKKLLKNCYWILLREVKGTKTVKKALQFSEEHFSSHERITEIEHELKETKENLQTVIEELETTNEEMQSSNEELVSANEELQSTNEELQSLNEELHTVNAEHQLKIKELIDLNDDLNNYFKSSDVSQIFIDRNLVIRKYTPTAVEQINLIASDIGRPITHISTNISYPNLDKDIQYVIKSQDIIQKEIFAKNNKWFLTKILPYVKQDQSVDGAIITFVDITTLKDLNNLITAVLNSSLNGIIAFKANFNSNGNVEDFESILSNDTSQKLLKKSIKQLVGKKLKTDFDEIEGLFEKCVKVFETGQPLHTENYYKKLDVWLEVVAVKMEGGVAVTFGDITSKKLGEEKIRIAYEELKTAKDKLKLLNEELEERVKARTKALSISEERFKTLSLATNDAIWDWEFATNKVWWNEGFKVIFGYSEKEIEPGVESWFNRIHPEDKTRVVNGIQNVITKGQKQWSGEYRLRKADGSYATVLDRAYVLNNENGMPYRMIGSMMDMTNLKKVQTELENTNKNLLKINADLDTFIYTASHDLKAPIANIEGLMYALQEQIKAEDNTIQPILNMVKVSIEKFKRTIEGLTDVAKIQKEQVIELEMINLLELIEEVKLSIKDMFISSHAVIKYDLHESLVRFSKKNLRSIIYNLLSNAIKYKKSDKDPIIYITSKSIGEYVVICVEDNGLGIEESKVPQIFQMFKRLHTHVEGTGIGLYIVKRMIENGGGKIEVESKAGIGTTFRLYLKK